MIVLVGFDIPVCLGLVPSIGGYIILTCIAAVATTVTPRVFEAWEGIIQSTVIILCEPPLRLSSMTLLASALVPPWKAWGRLSEM